MINFYDKFRLRDFREDFQGRLKGIALPEQLISEKQLSFVNYSQNPVNNNTHIAKIYT